MRVEEEVWWHEEQYSYILQIQDDKGGQIENETHIRDAQQQFETLVRL